MIIIGIDPGSTFTGVAALKVARGETPLLLALDTIEVGEVRSNYDRICAVMDRVDAFMVSHRPDIAALEEFEFHGHGLNVEAQACYRLVGNLYELRHKAILIRLTAREWREQLLSRRLAHKVYIDGREIPDAYRHQLQAMIKARLEIESVANLTPHELDAIGIALVAADRQLLAQAALVEVAELRRNGRRGRGRRRR
jgi:Holliday junction resolvasome RuvABC endonuclease subunit